MPRISAGTRRASCTAESTSRNTSAKGRARPSARKQARKEAALSAPAPATPQPRVLAASQAGRRALRHTRAGTPEFGAGTERVCRWCLCGAGTSHEVRKEDLKPAKYVIRQQKRAAKQGAGAGGSSQPQTQRGKQAEQVVIDEEDEDFA